MRVSFFFPVLKQPFPWLVCFSWFPLMMFLFFGVLDRTVQSNRTRAPHPGSGGGWSGIAMSHITWKECYRHGGGMVPAALLSGGSSLPKWQGSGWRAGTWIPGPDGVAERNYWWGEGDPQDQESKVLRWRRVHMLLPRSFLPRRGSNGIESGRWVVPYNTGYYLLGGQDIPLRL